MKTKDLIDLRAVRQAAGLSQAELGALVKMEQPYVSSLETGAKPMSVNSSKRLGAPLGADSTILFVCNRMRAIERAMERRDAADVLASTKAIVQTGDHFDLSPRDEGTLDALIQIAVQFAEDVGIKSTALGGPICDGNKPGRLRWQTYRHSA